MRLLFAILLLAVAGLLWATVAAAQHIRRARGRRRGSLPPEDGLTGSKLPPSVRSESEKRNGSSLRHSLPSHQAAQ